MDKHYLHINPTKEYFSSEARHLRLDFNIDVEGIAREAESLKQYYYTHREGSYQHKGWKSLVLHGLSESHTGHWKSYGFSSSYDAYQNMRWTSIADKCPKTMDFLLNHFPCKHFGRVRFMLLEAGGIIATHKDSRVPLLENTNISLINPTGCSWLWEDRELFDMPEGSSHLMNIYYPHGVLNNSNHDRYHLIVHRFDCTKEWKTLIESACMEQNVTGSWIEHEVLI